MKFSTLICSLFVLMIFITYEAELVSSEFEMHNCCEIAYEGNCNPDIVADNQVCNERCNKGCDYGGNCKLLTTGKEVCRCKCR
ncbi:hypothetical protein FRX31_017306 [Thalictrum thalictroides]|uniref:Defensin-like protein n=1 Tax=Thalictrum thalictroides TaxID=46969 RepID=A0A7J6W847_THATH|nr:hypothetical protein FRX31_017306 [Thalictrum thalictroides]